MPITRVDDFKAKLKGGGARSNLFDVLFSYPLFAGGDAELTNFMCKAASLPASSQGDISVPFRGRVLHVAGDRIFEPWTVQIINDTDMAVRNAMERWMNGINAHTENSGLTSPVDYQTDLTVRQIDKNGDVLKAYVFRGAYPINISEIEVSNDATDTIEEFSLTFSYQYWTSDTTS